VRLLVTGGAGYIGSVVSRLLLAEGHAVTVLDDLSTGHADAVAEGADFVEGDLSRSGEVLAGNRYDGVLHFAAKSLVGQSMVEPSLYWRNNVGGTRDLLDAVTANGVPRFVFSSTAAVYGEPDELPITESAVTRPTNTYGASKLAVDYMLRDEAVAHGLGAISLRYFNVGGASRGAGERHATETHVIPIALDVAAGLRPALDVYGTDWPTPDGTCIRDYVHVEDLARAHVLALNATEPSTHVVCNLGNGDGFSVHDVVETVKQVTGLPLPTRESARRPGDPARLVASHERATQHLGWTPEADLARIVADAWAFHRSRAAGQRADS
jgi:UDP-glucose 4-epimerase